MQTEPPQVVVLNQDDSGSRHLLEVEGPATEIELQGLEPGRVYYLSVLQEGTGGCEATLALKGKKSQEATLHFKAKKDRQRLLIYSDYLKSGCTPYVWLSVMRIGVVSVKSKEAPTPDKSMPPPISTSTASSPQQLIEDVLIGGGCFEVSNITYSGSSIARGTFTNGASSIGIQDGMIISSGPISTATGPNTTTGAGASVGGGTDIDLAGLVSGIVVFDAAVIEFDFTPTISQVTFDYVFASEEYCDFVNSPYNDVFGFFLSGPGINGPFTNNAENIALIPGTTTPVTINNVNHLVNSAYYISNQPFAQGGVCASHPIAGPPGTQDCQFDGFTTVLTVTANVIPCETYHIKLAVGDGSDAVYDSAVFFRANSFVAGGEAEVTAINPATGTNVIYEDCGTGFFEFVRTQGDISQPVVLDITIGGTATPGVDYVPLPNPIVIPPYQNSIQIPISVISDLIIEGSETITITLDLPCSCATSEAEIIIEELPELDVSLPDVTVCSGLPVQLEPAVSGGVPFPVGFPYQYQWSNGSTGPFYVDFPTEDGQVSITVTDFCGQMDSAFANIDVYTLEAAISGQDVLCDSTDEAGITVDFTGPGPWDIVYTIDSVGPYNLNDITNNPYTFTTSQPGVYEILAVISEGCVGEGLGEAVIGSSETFLDTLTTDPSCYNYEDGSIDLTVTGTSPPFTFNWSNGSTAEDPVNLGAGDYTVTVTDSVGCESNLMVTLGQPDSIAIVVDSIQGVSCANPTGGSIDISVSGGAGNYTYLWSSADTTQDVSGLTSGTYTVQVSDVNNCPGSMEVYVPGDTSVPIAAIFSSGNIDCSQTIVTLDGSGSSSGPDITYQWTTPDGSIVGAADQPVIQVDAPGSYELTVTDMANGCFAASSVLVNANTTLPVANAGPSLEINCFQPSISLDGTASSAGPNITYTWTTADGNIVSGDDTATPVVDAPGTYQITVLNTDNQCESTDLVVITQDMIAPPANAGSDANIDCMTPTSVLGDPSAPGTYTYTWTTADGNIVSGGDTPTPTVDAEGTYILTVLNTDNGCTATDEVLVTDVSVFPTITLTPAEDITCYNPSIQLDAGGSSTGPNFVYAWTTSDGNIVSGADTPNPVIDEGGTYELTITDTANGCESADQITVQEDQNYPVLTVADPPLLSCLNPSMQLDASGSSSGPQFTFEWSTVDGNIVSGSNTSTPVINEAGTYVVLLTNTDNGCQATTTVVVNSDAETPQAEAEVPQELNCGFSEVTITGAGSSTGANFEYNWTTPDGNILSGQNSLFALVDAPGSYTLYVSNTVNGCVDSATVEVTQDVQPPQISIANPEELTCAMEQLTIDAGASGSGPNFVYSWLSPNGNIVSGADTPTPLVDAPGVYYLELQNTDNQCVSMDSVLVSEDVQPPQISIANPEVLDCATEQLTIDATASDSGPDFVFSWLSPNGNILSGEDTPTPLVDAPGTYELEILNTNNGCTSSMQVVVNQDITPPVAMIQPPGMITCGTPELTLDGTASSSGPNIIYQWTSGDGNIVSGEDTPTPLIDEPGHYMLEVINQDNHCVDTFGVSVQQNTTPPVAEAGQGFVLDCNTLQVSLDGTASDSGPQYSYQWVTADGNIVSGANTLTPVIDAPGTYELIVVNQDNDCEAGDQVLVEEDANQPVAAAMEPEDLTCAQTQITIDASPSSQGPNYEYSWQIVSGGNIVSGADSLALSVDAPGIYELTVLNTDNGCEESIQVEVEENTVAPEAQAAAPQLITCTNTAVPLDGSGSDQGANYSYQWMTTDGNIVSGATSLNPIVDQTGTYILEVYNAENGCTQTASVSVGEDLQPPILSTEEPEELNCAVEQTPLSVIVSGPAGATFSYAWTTADGQIVSGADQPQPLIAAPGTYEVLVTNENNGCEETAEVQVFQDITPPVAEAGNAAEITCDNAVVSLNGAGSSSGANFTYLWSGSGLVSGENTLVPQVNEAGSYQLTVTNEDNHCTSADVVVVSENTTPPVVVLAEADPITCAVETVALNPAGTDAGANFSWLWSTPDGQFYDLSDPQAPLVNAPGTYILEVENDLNGCVETAQVQVQEDKTEPGAEAGPDLELNCHLTQVNLNAQANVQGIPLAYSWTTTGGNILNGADEQDPLINAPGLYEVTVTNLLNGCTSTDALTVTENMPQTFDFETDDPGCAGQTGSIVFQTVIGGAPPYLYSVDNGQSFSSSPVFNSLEPGAYDLVVMDANDCPLDDVAFIPEGLEVLVDLEAYVLTSYGETTILNAITNIAPDDIEEIIWSPTDGLSCTDCLNPSAQPDETTYYFVTIRTKDGCEADAKVLVVVDKQAAIYVPNAFSPNGDGNNDLFMIFAGPNQVEKVRNFLVFNRWGETVFEYHNFDPNNPAYGWDGTFRGQPLNPAVFAWYAEIEFKDGRVELFEGDVQLVR